MITFIDTFAGVDGTQLPAHVPDQGFGSWAEYNLNGYPGTDVATIEGNKLECVRSGALSTVKTYISGNDLDLSKDFEVFFDYFANPGPGNAQLAHVQYFDPAFAPDPTTVLGARDNWLVPGGVDLTSGLADLSSIAYMGALPVRFGLTFRAATATAQAWMEPAGGGARTMLTPPMPIFAPFVTGPAGLILTSAPAPAGEMWIDNLTFNTHLLQPTATPTIVLPMQVGSHGFRCCFTLDITQSPGVSYQLWVKPTGGAWTMISTGPLPSVTAGVVQCILWLGGSPATTYQVAIRLTRDGDYNPGADGPDPTTWPVPSQTTTTTTPGQGGPYTPPVPATPEADPAVPGTLNCDT